jgi:hypothetical protein
MRHVVQEWCAAAVERLKIHGFLVWRARLPTPREEANPCEGQGAHGCLGRLGLGALLLVVDLRPEGMPWRFSRPLHKRLAQERRTLEAASGPRPSCHCVPSRAPSPHIVGVPRQRRNVPVVRQRPRGGVEPRPPRPLVRRQTTGSRDAPGRGARWLYRSRPWLAR